MHILFVCLGNICRSPTAEAVFRHRAGQAGMLEQLVIDSCGTGGWHCGKPPDARARAAGARRGYDLSTLRARQLQVEDFHRFDLMLAMDRGNLADILALRPSRARARAQLFLDFLGEGPNREVPDPYYGGDEGFDQVLDLVERASDRLLEQLGTRQG